MPPRIRSLCAGSTDCILAQQAAFGRTTATICYISTDDGGAASHRTQPRITFNPSPRSAFLGLPFCPVSHGFQLVPIQACTFSHEPKPAVLTGYTPAISWTHTSPAILFACPLYITPSSAFSNQGRLRRATFSSDISEYLCLPEILDPAQRRLFTNCTCPFRIQLSLSGDTHEQTQPAPQSVRKPTTQLFYSSQHHSFQTAFWQM